MAEYIEREALLDRMNDYCVRNCPDTTYCISCFMTDAKEIVDSQDAEDVQPVKHGKWKNDVQCSECGWYMEDDVTLSPCFVGFNYCPNCGADMREKQDEPI